MTHFCDTCIHHQCKGIVSYSWSGW